MFVLDEADNHVFGPLGTADVDRLGKASFADPAIKRPLGNREELTDFAFREKSRHWVSPFE